MNRRQRRAGLAFARQTQHEWHPFERVDVAIAKTRFAGSVVEDAIAFYRNNVYAVQVYTRDDALHLAVRRHDGDEVRGWSDLQRIKNEIVSPERTAIEVYPPEAEVMDAANMRHLFVLPDGVAAPFSIQGGWR